MSNYTKTIYHDELNESKRIIAYSAEEFYFKERAQLNRWQEKWEKKQETEKLKQNKAELANIQQVMEDKAIQMSAEIDSIIDEMLNSVTNANNYKQAKAFDNFYPKQPDAIERKPRKRKAVPIEIKRGRSDARPTRDDPKFSYKRSAFDFIPSIKTKNMNINEESFLHAEEKWINDQAVIEDKYQIKIAKEKARFDSKNEEYAIQYEKDTKSWSKKKIANEKKILKYKSELIKIEKALESGDGPCINAYFDSVLKGFKPGLDYDFSFAVEFVDDSKILVIDFTFPSIDDIPKVKKVSYIKSKNDFKETLFNKSELNKLYETTIYNISILLINHVLNYDKYGWIESVVLNGFLDTVDLATGNAISPCFLSVMVKTEDFKKVNLRLVDPKEWFKHSKGVSAAKIISITPIKPILMMSKEDSRFTEGYDILHDVGNSSNLAAMHWEDFENLIRELFQKEFSRNGGEVKITQASRDGGVDAIAFDPDPIRGGKIVIQAKRYTNTVGVSAVRDLYGTVVNEGANKGILVTTSDFGSDSHKFAADKPILLLNGGHLLFMLQEHVTEAHIDIKDAKRIYKENNS